MVDLVRYSLVWLLIRPVKCNVVPAVILTLPQHSLSEASLP